MCGIIGTAEELQITIHPFPSILFMPLYPGKDAGLSGPIPSIRLKLIREALEDFEYMTLAAQQGHQAQVDEIVGSLAQSFDDWIANPDAYLSARAKIAALIAVE